MEYVIDYKPPKIEANTKSLIVILDSNLQRRSELYNKLKVLNNGDKFKILITDCFEDFLLHTEVAYKCIGFLFIGDIKNSVADKIADFVINDIEVEMHYIMTITKDKNNRLIKALEKDNFKVMNKSNTNNLFNNLEKEITKQRKRENKRKKVGVENADRTIG